jgi:hypothetical protein
MSWMQSIARIRSKRRSPGSASSVDSTNSTLASPVATARVRAAATLGRWGSTPVIREDG